MEAGTPTREQAAAADEKAGLLYGVSAYVLWGAFPLFFPLLKPAGAGEILAQRIVWSLLAVVAILAVRRNLSFLPALLHDRRRLGLLAAAAVLVAINWGTFIYAVNSDHVIEGSLGYFITPLVSAAFGVFVFREKLRPRQIAALALGAVAVTVLTVDYGRLPWIALTLAFSFGTYGLVKKLAGVGAAESLALETLILLVPAGAYIAYAESTGSGTFTGHGAGHTLLLIASGPVTAIPLLFFSAAVTRVALTMIGMLQYIAPVLQFLVGLIVVSEAMPASRWIGFGLVWAALVVLSVDGMHAAHRSRAASREAALEPT
ncbi:MAG: chloramphenicol-sensitive protein RarD [Thermoleophilaceae bacterium]|nr:chloramphenicol-sensitive protein RarD [Thermoleophilaceae bacterium]